MMSSAFSTDVLGTNLPGMKARPAFAHEPSMPPETCGTTLMAIEFDKGVVIGADSRTSTGSYVHNRVTDKLTELTNHIFCCRSGSAGDTQAITDIVKYRLETECLMNDEPPTVFKAAQLFREFCYEYRDSISAGMIVAGWDAVSGGQVFSIPAGGMVIRRKAASGGSGSTFVYGYLDSNYKEGMKQNEAEKFIKDAVTLATLKDGSSGGVCRLGIITEKGIERKLFKPPQMPTFLEAQ